jgi:hypothetical protein
MGRTGRSSVAVETAVVHLVGAMALPVWTLVRFDVDYRWLLDREDAPWYPTMRLFRQAQPLDWAPVVEEVKVELERLCCESRSTRRGLRELAAGPPRPGPA